jgi:hypothetical protein|nr:MAG TPA: hypothetical protein [Caudoviricetes sp.]
MSNIEKLINLQKRFEKDARYFADKEDYTSFEKAIEDFIVEAGRLNPDINTRDLLSRHLSKASKVKSYSDALQVMNSVSSDITILSMDLHGKGEPIFAASEYDKLVRDNNIEYAKDKFEIFEKSFDLLKKNNSDRFSKIDDLRNLYLGNVKNYKDKVFKFPHLVDTEQRKLFDTLKDIITKQVFDTFEKDREILLSYLSEIAEIGKAYVDRNVDFSDRLLDGYHIQKRREAIGESLDIEKLRRDLDKSNEKNIESLIDSIKKCFENYVKGVENLMIEHSKLYNDRIERTRAERVILGGQDEVKSIIERYKKQLEDIITSELSKDEEIFYSIMDELENSINESDENTNLYEVSGEFEYNIKFNFGRLRDDVLDDFDLMKKKQIDLQKEHLQKILNGENVNQDISKEIMDVIKEYEYKTESLYKRFRDDIQVDCENFIENLYDIYTGNVDKNKAKDFAKTFVSKGFSDVQEIERNLIYKTNMEMKKVSMESYEKLVGKSFTGRDIDTHIGELISFYEGRRERTEGFFDLGWKKVKKTSENFINEFGLDVVYLNESKFNESLEKDDIIKEIKNSFNNTFNKLGKNIKDSIQDDVFDKFSKEILHISHDFKDGIITDREFKKDIEDALDKFSDKYNLEIISNYDWLESYLSDDLEDLEDKVERTSAIKNLFDRYKKFISSIVNTWNSLGKNKEYKKDVLKRGEKSVNDFIHEVIKLIDRDSNISDRDFENKIKNLTFKIKENTVERDEYLNDVINRTLEKTFDDFDDFIIKERKLSESRRDTFFEAEEEKKPKISKEEKEKLKTQLDNFFADKKEAKATELKKSIVDRDKAIEDVILKYSTEKEKIQREYSKNIQAAKSEAEANKLRAERDEELQRLSLEKATSIEDLKERQKKEEASIREKYQTLFDKKLEEYKDSLEDTISDFAKDIERGIENGIKSNPIFQ